MNYQAKINSAEFEKFRNSKGRVSISFRITSWIHLLSNKKEFDRFFNIEENVSGFRRLNVDDGSKFRVEGLDRDKWRLFLGHCKESKMFGNYAINLLVQEYNKRGDLFLIKI